MEHISPVKSDLDHPGKAKRYSASMRLWHWLNALVITGSLLTVLVNSTILKGKTAVPIVKSALAEKGATISDDQARNAVHGLRDLVWEWHTYIGYALAALLLFRLLLEFFQLAEQKLMHKLSMVYRQYFITKQQRELAGHEFWVKTIYAVFYLLLLVQSITGIDLAFEDDVPALKPFHFLKQVHELNMYLILAFIVVHIAGVYLAERRSRDNGIVSAMIGGGELNEFRA